MVSALLIQGVPVECINQAAIHYHLPASLILSVLTVEGGRVGTASRNRNGSMDYGPMQINSTWLKTLSRYGYTRERLQYNPCANVMAGAWILSQNIADASGLWQGVGGYHSYTPALNARYRARVANIHQLMVQYLSSPMLDA